MLKILLWTLVTIVGLVLTVFILLQTDLGRGWVRDIVVDVLNDTFQGTIEVRRIGGSLPFDVTIEGFVMRDPEGRVALSVEKLSADFHPLELFDSRVHLSDIHVEGPVINLFDDAGGMMLARAFSPRVAGPDDDPAASPWVVELENIALDKGMLGGIVPGQDFALTELGLDLTLGVGPAPYGPRWHDVRLRGVAAGGSPLSRVLEGSPLIVRTQGGLRGEVLVFEHLQVLAGKNSVVAQGELDLAVQPGGVPGLPTGTLLLTSLHLDLDALPLELQLLLPGIEGAVDGSGQVRLSSGRVEADLGFSTALGVVSIEGGAEVLPALGAYGGIVRIFDARFPTDPRLRVPDEVLDGRLDVVVEVSGHGDPLGPGGTFTVDGEIEPRSARANTAAGDLGHVVFGAVRVPGDLELAPTIDVTLAGWGFALQPWLGLADQPDLVGTLRGVWLEGSVTLPSESVPTPAIAATFAFDGAVDGAIATGDRLVPVSAPLLAALGSVRWDGGAPFGHVELTTTDLAVESATASVVALSVELGDTADLVLDRMRARGVLRVANVTRLDVHADALEVPFDLTLDEGLPVGDIGLVATSARTADHAVDRAFADLRLERDGEGLRLHGDVRVAGLALERGAHRVGAAQLGIDYRLLATEPLDPLVVASRGTVRGSATQVRSGARGADEVVFDLRVAAPDGLAGELRISGTSSMEGVDTPEVVAGRADVELDIALAGDRFSGRVVADAKDLVLPLVPVNVFDMGSAVAGGRRLRSAKVELAVDRAGRMKATGTFAEPTGIEGDFAATGRMPRGRQPFTVRVERLRIKPTRVPGRRDSADLMVLQGFELDADGWIRVESVTLGNDKSGLVLAGKFHPGRGEIDLRAKATELRIDEWIRHAETLSGFGIEGLPLDGDVLAVGGTISFELEAQGTLADPTLTLKKLRLRDARFGPRKDGGLDVDLVLERDRLTGSIAVRWPDGGKRKDGQPANGVLTIDDIDLPVVLSFAPLSVHLDRTAPISLDLMARVPNVRAALAWGEDILGQPLLPDVTGGAQLEVAVSGTGLTPVVDVAFFSRGLGDWTGSVALTASPQPMDPSTWSTRLVVSEIRKGKESAGLDNIVRLDVDIPTRALDAVWDLDVAAFRTALGRGRGGLGLFVPERELGTFPGLALIPDFGFADVRVASDVRFEGHYPVLSASGTIDIANLGVLGVDGGLQARFTSSGEQLIVMLFAADGEEGLVSGQIAIPRFGTLLADPGRFAELIEDKDFRVDLHTASMATSTIELIDSALGETIERYFPNSILAGHVLARGQAGGPEASVLFTVVSAIPEQPQVAGESAPELDPLLASRMLAEQTYVLVQVKRLETEVRVLLLPRSSIGSHLMINARADLGTTAMLDGRLDGWRGVPIEGQIKAEGFALDGLFVALEGIVGAESRGELGGVVDIDGTLGAPRFNGGLSANFGPLVVPNIRFHDWLGLQLNFADSRIELVPVDITVPTRSGEPRTATLSFAMTMPSLDPGNIKLEGAVDMARFPVMNTDEIDVQVTTSDLRLTGTVAAPSISGTITVDKGVIAPDIAQGSVRPLGLPADVRIVRGVPKPTGAPRPRQDGTLETGVQLRVKVVIPEGTVLVEPHIELALGEVRALLEPYGTLDISTIQREVVIVGDIKFPDDEELRRRGAPEKQNSIYLYGKRFVLDSDALVRFTGNMEIDPQVSMTARYNIAHVDLSALGLAATSESEVVVRVTGSPSTQLQIDFGSNPAMDQSNILNIIALDQPAGGGDLAAAVPGQVLGAILSMATLELTRSLQATLKVIDVLRIDTNSTLEQARITMGKQLTDRIFLYTYVNVNADTERESVYEFSAEYRFNQVFSIIGKWGDIGELSINGSVKLQP